MDIYKKNEIINSFIQNYGIVQSKELFMNGVNDESADSICAAAITIIEMLSNKEEKNETV